MRTLTRKGKLSGFTLVEILIVIAILAILAVVTFVVINPAQRINDANDTKRREDVGAIVSAVTLYSVDNGGATPTYDLSGTPTALPPVTTANVMTNGAPASDLEGITPTYLTTIPTDPGGSSYRVGVLSGGAVIVGATLSDNTEFTRSE
jgi:prepilin-type N-terminal cleavage/methylation domain-containing protein